jgi:hypothetical protein
MFYRNGDVSSPLCQKEVAGIVEGLHKNKVIKMKDRCSSVSKLLGKYLDQEVTDRERALVESHLLDCRVCQSDLKSMEELGNLVKAPVEEAVRKEDFQRVWQNVQRELRLRDEPSWWTSLRAWLGITLPLKRKVWIPAVVTALILVVIAVPLLFKKTPSYSALSVVEYVESPNYNVMVYESESSEVTIIWIFEGQENHISSS